MEMVFSQSSKSNSRNLGGSIGTNGVSANIGFSEAERNNKLYVGSACGEFGIWQRWSEYVYSYNGGNKGLEDLHKKVGENHFKKYFRFILLEYFTNKVDESYIIDRENFWKEALNSRIFGYNKN